MRNNHPPSGESGNFATRVMNRTPGAEIMQQCLQCGSCSGSCPSGDDMQHSPRQLIALINANMEAEALASNAPWFCVSCYACTTRCPKNIPITDLMYTLKQMAIEAGCYQRSAAKFSETFIGFVEQRGRSFELGLATRYHLAHHPMQLVKLGLMGFNMMRHNRLALRPKAIREIDQLSKILAEAKAIAAQEIAQ